MPSPTVLLTRKRSTGTSRPVADGQTDDTMRRQPPDGPSLHSRPRKVGIAILSGGGMSISEDEERGRSSFEREPVTSQLHPYVSNSSEHTKLETEMLIYFQVINFTSPIDLSDEPPQDSRLGLHAV